ncbi:MAG: dihydroorotase [Flavobacteriaceae bacterium]|nr:dihydroorotase [Flavobacteriaceae bacterium]
MNVLLKSATIIQPNSELHHSKKDILIEAGIIKKIATSIENVGKCQLIDLPNLHVSIGWFDGSVSFGEPGYEERETLENGLKTAAHSGFTGIALNPNTNPIIDNKSAVEFLINKSKKSPAKLFPIGSFTQKSEGKELAELFDMKNSGACAFGDYKKSIENAQLLKIGLQYAQIFGGLIMSYPQNKAVAGEGLINEGINSTCLGLKGIPNFAEELQITRDLAILDYTGGKLHFPTISTEGSVDLIRKAKSKGLNVSCSVAIHHLKLNDNELKEFDTNYKILPPLRTSSDQKALLKGIKDGTIDFITGDHCPIDIEHKKVEFQIAQYGTIGLESFYGALNSVLKTDDFIENITTKPRQIFGISIPKIAEKEIAEITLFNPDEIYKFTVNQILSTSKNSAFIGSELKGKVYGIFAQNQLILNQ